MIDRIPIAIDALGDGVLTALADATRGEKLSPGLRAELGVAVRAEMLRRVDDDDRTDGKMVTFRLEVLTFDQVDLAGREVLGLADAADRCKALALVMGGSQTGDGVAGRESVVPKTWAVTLPARGRQGVGGARRRGRDTPLISIRDGTNSHGGCGADSVFNEKVSPRPLIQRRGRRPSWADGVSELCSLARCSNASGGMLPPV